MLWRVGGREHLRPRQVELHRPAGGARRHRRQQRVRPLKTFTTKTAAGERAEHAHALARHAEGLGQQVAGGDDRLRRIPHHQLVAVPGGDGGRRLHRVVGFDRHVVHRPHRHQVGRRQRAVDVAAAVLGVGAARRLRRLGRRGGGRFQVEQRLLLAVAHRQQRCGVAGLLQRRRHDHGDVLAGEVDGGAGERQQVFAQVAVALRSLDLGVQLEGWRVLVREHGQDARRVARRGAVDGQDLAPRDGRLHQHGVRQVRRPRFGGVLGGAGDLAAAVRAVKRCADGWAHAKGSFRSRVRRSLPPPWRARAPACAGRARS
jgi:hypothetical protein